MRDGAATWRRSGIRPGSIGVSARQEWCAACRPPSKPNSWSSLGPFEGFLVGTLDPEVLRTALVVSVDVLLDEGEAGRVPSADVVSARLDELRRCSSS